MKKNKENIKLKTSIDELNLYDLPMVGIFKDKRFTAYTLSTLAGIDVDDLNDMNVVVEDFLSNAEEGRRNMRMDARVNLKGRGERSNIEIQRIRKDDETARALFYAGGLLTDFPKGIKKIPATKNTVIFICDFDPFENTPYAGMTRMKFTLRSDDDEGKFHTMSGKPYPFEGLTIILYNGAKDWKKHPPRSEEEERVRIYLEDMKNTDPGKMTSEIARTVCRNYKEDPRVVEKVKDWILYKYGEQLNEELDAQMEKYKKKMAKEFDEMLKAQMEAKQIELDEKMKSQLEARQKEFDNKMEDKIAEIKKENEDSLKDQKLQMAERLLSSSSLTISEIARITELNEDIIEEISKKQRDYKS